MASERGDARAQGWGGEGPLDPKPPFAHIPSRPPPPFRCWRDQSRKIAAGKWRGPVFNVKVLFIWCANFLRRFLAAAVTRRSAPPKRRPGLRFSMRASEPLNGRKRGNKEKLKKKCNENNQLGGGRGEGVLTKGLICRCSRWGTRRRRLGLCHPQRAPLRSSLSLMLADACSGCRQCAAMISLTSPPCRLAKMEGRRATLVPFFVIDRHLYAYSTFAEIGVSRLPARFFRFG